MFSFNKSFSCHDFITSCSFWTMQLFCCYRSSSMLTLIHYESRFFGFPSAVVSLGSCGRRVAECLDEKLYFWNKKCGLPHIAQAQAKQGGWRQCPSDCNIQRRLMVRPWYGKLLRQHLHFKIQSQNWETFCYHRTCPWPECSCGGGVTADSSTASLLAVFKINTWLGLQRSWCWKHS